MNKRNINPVCQVGGVPDINSKDSDTMTQVGSGGGWSVSVTDNWSVASDTIFFMCPFPSIAIARERTSVCCG